MNPESAIDLTREAIKVCIMIGGPLLAVSLVVGLLIGLSQAVTQVHDQSISTVPKILLVLLTVALALPWFAEKLIDFSTDVFGTPMMAVSAPAVETESEPFEEIVIQPSSNDDYYTELSQDPQAALIGAQSPVFRQASTTMSRTPFPKTLVKKKANVLNWAPIAGSSGNASNVENLPSESAFRMPSTLLPVDSEEGQPELEESKSPFQLPHYRFSRRPTEDKEG